MSQKKAIEVAEGQGYTKLSPQAPSPLGFQTLAFTPVGVRDPDGSLNLREYHLAFCQGRLVSVDLEYKHTMGTLMDLLESLIRQYGVPSVDASSQMLNDGRLRSLKFQFRPTPADKTHVSVNGSVTSDTNFNIQVFHSIEYRCEPTTKARAAHN